MPRIVFACLCTAVLAMLAACASSGQVESASAGSSSADSATSESSSGSDSISESDSAPPTETSGTESARPPQGGQGTLTVASLPLGANADGDGCMTIAFEGAASQVPAGMTLVVTGITFTPDAVKFGGSACPQETPVCRPGLVLTETGSDECFASITTGATAVGTKVAVQFTAAVNCVGGQVAACAQFKAKVESDEKNQGVATFEVPEPNQPETTPTVEPPSPSESVGSAGSPDSVTTSSSS